MTRSHSHIPALRRYCRSLPALLAGWLLAGNALACECLWQGPFVDAARDADLVVAGEISQVRGNALDLAVEQVLNGREGQEIIRIWAAHGDLCRPQPEQFPAGSRWVLAVQRIDQVPAGGFNPNTPNFSYGREGDYALSACGVYWLPLRGGHVRGNLLQSARWEYEGEVINPVMLELLQDYLQGQLPRERLAEAARPRDELRRLMDATRGLLDTAP